MIACYKMHGFDSMFFEYSSLGVYSTFATDHQTDVDLPEGRNSAQDNPVIRRTTVLGHGVSC